MARKLYKDKLLKRKDINERIKHIPDTVDYISENGNVYKKKWEKMLILKKAYFQIK